MKFDIKKNKEIQEMLLKKLTEAYEAETTKLSEKSSQITGNSKKDKEKKEKIESLLSKLTSEKKRWESTLDATYEITDEIQADFQQELSETFKKVDSLNDFLTKATQSQSKVVQKTIKQIKDIGKVGERVNKNYVNYQQTVEKLEISQAQAIDNTFNKATAKKSITTISNRKGSFVSASGTVAPKNNTPITFFDFETIGEQGKSTFSPYQLSSRQGNSATNYFIKLTKEGENFAKQALQKVRDGKKITEDEKRSLLSLANVIKKDNQIVSQQRKYATNVNLQEKQLLAQIETGLQLLGGYDSSITNLTDTKDLPQIFKKIGKGSILAGHNLPFDLSIAKKFGAKYTGDYIDTIELARKFLRVGQVKTTTAKSGMSTKTSHKMLKGMGLDQLADFFSVKIDESRRHTSDYDVELNQIIYKELIEHIKNSVGSQDLSTSEIKKGQFSRAIKNYYRKSDIERSLKKKSSGEIDEGNFSSLLFKKGDSYSFDGIVEDAKKHIASFTSLTSGEKVFFSSEDIREIESLLSGVFGGEFHDLKDFSDNDIKASIFRKGGGFYELKRILNKEEKEPNLVAKRKVLEQDQVFFSQLNHIFEQIDKIDISGNAKNLLLTKVGEVGGGKQYQEFDSSYLNKLVTEKTKKTAASYSASYRQYAKSKAKYLGKTGLSLILEMIDEIDQSGINDLDIEQGKNPYYNVGTALVNNLVTPNSAFMKTKEYLSAQTGYVVPKLGEGLQIDKAITTLISKASETFRNKGSVSDLYESASGTSFADALSGQHLKNRLSKMGQGTSLVKIGGTKNVNGQTAFAKRSVGDSLQRIIDTANAKGIGVHVSPSADGSQIKLGFYNNSSASDFYDDKMSPLWDKMATTIFALDNGEGILDINGNKKVNFMSMRNVDGVPELISAQEQAVLNVLNLLEREPNPNSDRASFVENILGTEDYRNMDKISAEQQLSGAQNRVWEESSIATSETVKNESAGQLEAGLTKHEQITRASSIHLANFLKSAAYASQAFRDENGNVREATEEELQDIQAIYYLMNRHAMDLVDVSNERYSVITQNESLMKFLELASAGLSFSSEGLKEEHFLSNYLNLAGSHSLSPFNRFNSQSNRSTNQFYKTLSKRKSSKYLKKSVFASELGDAFGVDNNSSNLDLYDVGYLSDIQIAKFFKDKKGTLPATSDSVIVPKSILESFSGSRPESFLFSIDGLSKAMKAFVKKEIAGGKTHVDLNKIVGKGINQQELGKSVYGKKVLANTGDIFKSLDVVGDKIKLSIDRFIEAKEGSKILLSDGTRKTISTVLEDSEFDKLANNTGNTGAQILTGFQKIGTKNIGSFLEGRYANLISTYISGATGKKLEKKKAEINAVIEKLPLLAKFLKYNANTGRWYSKASNQTDIRGLFANDDEIQRFFDPTGKNGLLETFGRQLFGEKYSSIPKLSSVAGGLANEYDYFDASGFEDTDTLEKKARVNVASREKDAIRRIIALAQKSGGITESLSKKIEAVFSTEGERKKEFEFQKEEIKTTLNNLNPDISKLSSDDIIRIVGGNVDENSLKDNEIALNSLITSPNSRNADESSFFPMEKLRRILEQRGKQKAKIVLDLNGNGNGQIIRTEAGKDISSFYVPRIFSKLDSVTYGLSEPERAFNSLVEAAGRQDKASDVDKVSEEGARYLAALENYDFNKESALYRALDRTGVPNAKAFKANALNTEENKTNANVLRLSSADVSAMLGKGSKKNIDSQLKNLQYLLNYLNGTDSKIIDTVTDELSEKLLMRTNLARDISRALKNNSKNNLRGFFHRYPSISGLDEIATKIEIDDTITSGRGRVSGGLAALTNTDFDGDVTRIWLPLLNQNFKNQSDFNNAYGGLEKVGKLSDEAAKLVYAKNNKPALLEHEVEENIGGRVVSGQDTIVTLMSKLEKRAVGSLSGISTAIRNAITTYGMDETGGDDPQTLINSGITRAFFEMLEQDSISAKKVGERLYAKAKSEGKSSEQEIYKFAVDEVDKLAKFIRNGSHDKNFYNELLNVAQSMGLLGENGEFNSIKLDKQLAFLQASGIDLSKFGITPFTEHGDPTSGVIKGDMLVQALSSTSNLLQGRSGQNVAKLITQPRFRQGSAKVTSKNLGRLINGMLGQGTNGNKPIKYKAVDYELITEKGRHDYVPRDKNVVAPPKVYTVTQLGNALFPFNGVQNGLADEIYGKYIEAQKQNETNQSSKDVLSEILKQYEANPVVKGKGFREDLTQKFNGLAGTTFHKLMELLSVNKKESYDDLTEDQKKEFDALVTDYDELLKLSSSYTDNITDKDGNITENNVEGKGLLSLSGTKKNQKSILDNIKERAALMIKVKKELWGNAEEFPEISLAMQLPKGKGVVAGTFDSLLFGDDLAGYTDYKFTKGIHEANIFQMQAGIKLLRTALEDPSSRFYGEIGQEKAKKMLEKINDPNSKVMALLRGNPSTNAVEAHSYSEMTQGAFDELLLKAVGLVDNPNQFLSKQDKDAILTSFNGLYQGKVEYKGNSPQTAKKNQAVIAKAFNNPETSKSMKSYTVEGEENLIEQYIAILENGKEQFFRMIYNAQTEAIQESTEISASQYKKGSSTGKLIQELTSEENEKAIIEREKQDILNQRKSKQTGEVSATDSVLAGFYYDEIKNNINKSNKAYLTAVASLSETELSGGSPEEIEGKKQAVEIAKAALDTEKANMDALANSTGAYENLDPENIRENLGNQYELRSQLYARKFSGSSEFAADKEAQQALKLVEENIKKLEGIFEQVFGADDFSAIKTIAANNQSQIFKEALVDKTIGDAPFKMAALYTQKEANEKIITDEGQKDEGKRNKNLIAQAEEENKKITELLIEYEEKVKEILRKAFGEEEANIRLERYKAARTAYGSEANAKAMFQASQHLLTPDDKRIKGLTYDKAKHAYLDSMSAKGALELRKAKTETQLNDKTVGGKQRAGYENVLGLVKSQLKHYEKNPSTDLTREGIQALSDTVGGNDSANVTVKWYNAASDSMQEYTMMLGQAKQLATEAQVKQEQLNASIAQAQVPTQKSMGLLASIAKGFKASFRNLMDYSLAYMIIGKIKQLFQQLIQTTKELDKVMVDLQIVTGTNRKEAKSLLGTYNELALEIGRSTTSIATASNDWLRAGYEGEEAADLTKASMYLSVLGMEDSAQATTQLISSLKGWKIEASEVMGVVDKLTVTICGVCTVMCIGHKTNCR